MTKYLLLVILSSYGLGITWLSHVWFSYLCLSDLLPQYMLTSLYKFPQSAKACLGEIIYRFIAADRFSPECLLDYLDLSSEYTTLEIANRIEAAVHIWKQKHLKCHPTLVNTGKSYWGGKVKGFVSDTEKNKLLAHRADTLLQNLRIRFPGLPQTALDMSKIQYNKV